MIETDENLEQNLRIFIFQTILQITTILNSFLSHLPKNLLAIISIYSKHIFSIEKSIIFHFSLNYYHIFFGARHHNTFQISSLYTSILFSSSKPKNDRTRTGKTIFRSVPNFTLVVCVAIDNGVLIRRNRIEMIAGAQRGRNRHASPAIEEAANKNQI